MKLITLSERILKFIVSTYKDTLNDCLDFDLIKEHFPKQDEIYLIEATALLKQDGFITVYEADNSILEVTLLPEGIRNVESNTFIRKGYTILRNIKSLLP